MASSPKKGVTLANGMRYNHGQIIGPTLPTRSISGKPIHQHKYKNGKPVGAKCAPAAPVFSHTGTWHAQPKERLRDTP
jgi:hypothetical protein